MAFFANVGYGGFIKTASVDTAVCSTPTALQTHRLVLFEPTVRLEPDGENVFASLAETSTSDGIRDLRKFRVPFAYPKYAGCSLESIAPLNRIMRGWWKVSARLWKPLEHLKSGFSKIVTSINQRTFPNDAIGKTRKTMPGGEFPQPEQPVRN